MVGGKSQGLGASMVVEILITKCIGLGPWWIRLDNIYDYVVVHYSRSACNP